MTTRRNATAAAFKELHAHGVEVVVGNLARKFGVAVQVFEEQPPDPRLDNRYRLVYGDEVIPEDILAGIRAGTTHHIQTVKP